MKPMIQLKATALFTKTARGNPMARTRHLELSRQDGVLGDTNPTGLSPRQVCIAVEQSLRMHDVDPSGSRANIVVDGGDIEMLKPGAVVLIGDVQLRVTMACEPCAHGARLAGATTARFRNIIRYLAVVQSGGLVTLGDTIAVHPDVFEPVPDDFRTRCAWALDRIPPGRVVTSLEFLTAIGAGKSYARVLPRWLHAAGESGKPMHRVLAADLAPPSWAPDAYRHLESEGLQYPSIGTATYPLTKSLWFTDATSTVTANWAAN